MSAISPEACPRFEACNANLCPLDAEWSTRTYLSGEAVCFYLREFVKPGGPARVREHVAFIADAIDSQPELMNRESPLSRGLERAAKQGSKLAAGKALAALNADAHGDAT